MWFNEQLDSKELLQTHSSLGSCQTEASVGQGASSGNSAVGLSFGVLNSMEESSSQVNPVNYSNRVSGTGIKIRNRQHQVQPISSNVDRQGTAPRRLRLLKDSAESVENGKVRHASHSEEEDEVQSAVTEVSVIK